MTTGSPRQVIRRGQKNRRDAAAFASFVATPGDLTAGIKLPANCELFAGLDVPVAGPTLVLDAGSRELGIHSNAPGHLHSLGWIEKDVTITAKAGLPGTLTVYLDAGLGRYLAFGTSTAGCLLGCTAIAGDATSWLRASAARRIPDTKTFTAAGWLLLTSGNPAIKLLFSSETERVHFGRSAGADGRVFEFAALDNVGAPVVKMLGTTDLSITLNVWHHYAISVDVNAGSQRAQMYIDGVNDLASVVHSQDALMNFTEGGQYLPSNPGCKFWQVWMDPTSIDLSAAGQIDKFISAGKPVYLGDTGELPTGSQPWTCLQGNVTDGDATVNDGSTGDWTEDGTLIEYIPGPGV